MKHMKEYTSTAIIDASTDTVWAILTDAIGYTDWNPEIVGIDGRMALGRHITAHVRLASGVVRKVKLRVSAFDPPRRMEWRSACRLVCLAGDAPSLGPLGRTAPSSACISA